MSYNSLQKAKDVQEALDNTSLNGETITIILAQQDCEENVMPTPSFKDDSKKYVNKIIGGKTKKETNTLLVRNLPYTTTTESIQQLFPKAVSARIPHHSDTGTPKGLVIVISVNTLLLYDKC